MVTDTTPKGSEALRIARGLGYLVAAVLLIAAVYFYFVPALIPSQEGVFGCGTAASPPGDGFAKGACQGTATVNLYRSLALLGAALVVALGTFFLFREPSDGDWDEDDVDLARDGAPRRGERGSSSRTATDREDEPRKESRRGELRGAAREDDWDAPRRSRNDDLFGDEAEDAQPSRRSRRERDEF